MRMDQDVGVSKQQTRWSGVGWVGVGQQFDVDYDGADTAMNQTNMEWLW